MNAAKLEYLEPASIRRDGRLLLTHAHSCRDARLFLQAVSKRDMSCEQPLALAAATRWQHGMCYGESGTLGGCGMPLGDAERRVLATSGKWPPPPMPAEELCHL